MQETTRIRNKPRKNSTLSFIVINVPLINIISGFSVQILGRDTLHMGNIRALLFFSIILAVLLRFGLSERVTKRILLFLIYLFALILMSSDFTYSFTDTYLKVLVSMMMFPVGFYILSDKDNLTKFLKNLVIAGLFLCVNYIVAQIFKIGRSVYVEDSFYYGYAGIGSTVVLSYILLATPLLRNSYHTKAGRLIYHTVIFLSILFTFIALKRVAILALIIGFIVFVFSARRFKSSMKFLVIISILLVATMPLYYDVFQQRLEVRTTEDNEIDQEQRYYDIVFAWKDFKTKGLKHALIGTEAFNTPGYFGRERQVHVDYANLLIGTGIIGLTFYFLIYFSIYNRFKKPFKLINKYRLYTSAINKENLYTLHGVFSAILIASLIVSLSGGMHVITTRSILFILLGGICGTIVKYYSQFVKQNNSSKAYVK